MAVKNDNLGGTDWVEEKLTPTDLNDTVDEVLQAVGILTAQNAYQTLQANDVFENKDFLATDEFLSILGTNATIGTTGVVLVGYDEGNNRFQNNFQGDGADDTESAEGTAGSTASVTNSEGYKVSATADCVVVSITKHSTCTATRAIIRDSTKQIMAVATFSGDVATFASPQPSLISSQVYIFEADNSGASYNETRNLSPSYPYSGTNIDYTEATINGNDQGTGVSLNITSSITQTSNGFNTSTDGTVDTGTIMTLATAPNSIVVYSDATIETNATLTVSVSDDGGSTYGVTGGAINSIIDTTTLTGTNFAIRFVFGTSNSTNKSTLLGYGVSIID